MRLEKYQGYYIKKNGNGACQILDINQNPIQTAENIESAKNHIQTLRKINKPSKYIVSAYDNDNDTFFNFAHTNSKKQALWIYKNACDSFVNDTLNRISGFKLKDVDFIGLYENNQKIKVFDIYDKKNGLSKNYLNIS